MYLGVDYYPEQWPEELLEQDLARMARSSINCIRVAEFAWHLLEPRKGAYQFDSFLKLLDRADHYGLKVMLGTPTATVPAWLALEHPEILSVDEVGMTRHFGGRRQACLNSPAYLAACDAITTAMARAYCDHPAVIAWQIDNELGHETSDWCYCSACEREFQAYLKSEFGDIEDLNQRLGTVFWSQTYNDFAEIGLPKPTIPAKNPGLLLSFYRFRDWTLTRFVRRMATLLRRSVPAWQLITHNYPGDYYNKAQNFTDMSEALDVVALNNYPVWGGLEQPVEYGKTAMKLDQTRGFLPGKSFWITEQLIGAQAHTLMGYLPRPGQARLWSWQALLHGCHHLIYFRWRTAARGAEQFCYGVLDHDNQDGPRYEEMVRVFQEARHYEQEILEPVQARVALLYHPDNIYAWKIQPQSTGLDIHHEHFRLYQGFQRHNIPVDVIDARQNLDAYSILLVPAPMLITRAQIERLQHFLHQGGTVISSFRAGLKDQDNAVYSFSPNPWLELAQLKCYYIESLGVERKVPVSDGNEIYQATVWRDMLEIVNPQEVTGLFSYCDEFSAYSAVTSSQVGAGRLIHVGCAIADEPFWLHLAAETARRHGIPCQLTPYGVERTVRRQTQFLLNHNSFEVEWQGYLMKPYEVLISESESPS